MTRSASPLRYPGGKACLYDLTVNLLKLNGLQQRSYAEPYSGGCGLALNLLFSGHVSQIHLNDLDRSVWAFWKSTLDHTDDLVSRIENIDVSVDEWHRQREVQARKQDADIVDLGLSTFFLNRTNRSGIIHGGGIIGGKAQAGAWKMDCRFNKVDLIKRIRRIANYRNRIFIYNEDAEIFVGRIGQEIPDASILYVDPPYYEKGSLLYRNSYKPSDHERISKRLGDVRTPWFLTYDNVDPIKKLYESYESVELDIGYSVQTKRRGSELLVVSHGLRLPVEGMASAH
ncbi:DNA adenine methylase [Brevundimonas aurantiaca]|uniref:DNA adenine methylase n=1 Tax=Brevundimonas aurantiaca TaxID=74316 RepID=UPI00174C1E35|nr:DNA adenine methylase [Brevundimonas aurantiaca]